MNELAMIPVASHDALPALISDAGKRASWCFVESFTVNIRNAKTRTANARTAALFLRWCEEQGAKSRG
jgi:hypothetical protein